MNNFTEKFFIKNRTNNKITKKFILICIIVITIICSLCSLLYFNSELTQEEKDKRIAEEYAKNGYDSAKELVYDYYGKSTDALLWIQVLSEKENDKVKDKLIVKNQNLTYRSKDYYDYDITLYNDSNETITYIKINIYLKNDYEEIIHTDWTNWSGTLPPYSSVNIDTMIKKPKDTVSYYSVVIDEVDTK